MNALKKFGKQSIVTGFAVGIAIGFPLGLVVMHNVFSGIVLALGMGVSMAFAFEAQQRNTNSSR